MKKGTLIFSMLILLSVPLSARPTLNLTGVPGVVTIPYDTMGTQFSLTVTHSGDATDYFLGFSASSNGGYDPRILEEQKSKSQLTYNLFTQSGDVLKDPDTAFAANEVLSGSFPQSATLQQQTFLVDARVLATAFDEAGVYDDTITIQIYTGDPSGAYAKYGGGRTRVDLEVTVPNISELSIVGDGGAYDPAATAYTMDFGPLATGQLQNADMLFRSNSPYTLSVASANGGVLVNTLITTSTDQIPYTLRVNGVAANLGGNFKIDQTNAGTGPIYLRYDLQVEIGTFGVVDAGIYEDVLTFTLSAR